MKITKETIKQIRDNWKNNFNAANIEKRIRIMKELSRIYLPENKEALQELIENNEELIDKDIYFDELLEIIDNEKVRNYVFQTMDYPLLCTKNKVEDIIKWIYYVNIPTFQNTYFPLINFRAPETFSSITPAKTDIYPEELIKRVRIRINDYDGVESNILRFIEEVKEDGSLSVNLEEYLDYIQNNENDNVITLYPQLFDNKESLQKILDVIKKEINKSNNISIHGLDPIFRYYPEYRERIISFIDNLLNISDENITYINSFSSIYYMRDLFEEVRKKLGIEKLFSFYISHSYISNLGYKGTTFDEMYMLKNSPFDTIIRLFIINNYFAYRYHELTSDEQKFLDLWIEHSLKITNNYFSNYLKKIITTKKFTENEWKREVLPYINLFRILERDGYEDEYQDFLTSLSIHNPSKEISYALSLLIYKKIQEDDVTISNKTKSWYIYSLLPNNMRKDDYVIREMRDFFENDNKSIDLYYLPKDKWIVILEDWENLFGYLSPEEEKEVINDMIGKILFGFHLGFNLFDYPEIFNTFMIFLYSKDREKALKIYNMINEMYDEYYPIPEIILLHSQDGSDIEL